MYRETTHDIEIEVQPEYLPEPSRPDQGYFAFAYHVRITNRGAKAAKLLSRHWIITDGAGEVKEVKGDGVIGEQPRIESGKTHEYSSFCALPTPTGNMRGSYEMVDDLGNSFRVRIPLFFLRDLRNFH